MKEWVVDVAESAMATVQRGRQVQARSKPQADLEEKTSRDKDIFKLDDESVVISLQLQP